MTVRAKTTKPLPLGTRIRRTFEGEERQQAVVTVIFAIAIVAVILILVGAIGYSWYESNVRPLARVGSVEIGPQLARDRLELQSWRINNEVNRLTQANVANEIDAATLESRRSELGQQLSGLPSTVVGDLVSEIYQSQLATEEGITVSEQDVDEAVARELATQERRHVLGIVVTPVASGSGDETGEDEDDTGGTPSRADWNAALAKAEAARAALDSGREFGDVAREFSSADNAQTGGDFGSMSRITVPDEIWGDALFRLDLNGTTDVVQGADGSYYIGRVTEISPTSEEPVFREDLLQDVSEGTLRELLRYQIGAQRLNDKITAAALAETPEQARIAIIFIDGAFTDDPDAAEGEVDYSEIVFAPSDSIEAAKNLAADDPAWEAARVEAQAVFDELNALPAGDERNDRFDEVATETSDSESGEDGGSMGPSTRGLLPAAIGDALFEGTHEEGELIGPVRTDEGYVVLLYHSFEAAPEVRVAEVQDLLAQPGADFAQIARDHSDGPEAGDGGEVGWLTRTQLADDVEAVIFDTAVGAVSDPVDFGNGHYFFKIEERRERAFDADQVNEVRNNAFTEWFEPKLEQAQLDGVVFIVGQTPDLDDEDFDEDDFDDEDFDDEEFDDVDFDDEEFE